MKGIVFNLLESLVQRHYGEDAWDQLLDATGLDGRFTSLGSYADADLMRLVDAAAHTLKLSRDDTLRWFGRTVLPELASRFPQFFNECPGLRSFLLTLNHVIHPEVRKLYPGADVPEFDYDSSSDGILLMGYTSPRQLCSFGEGLIEGAANHFGERVRIDQPQCTKQGDPKCVFRICFLNGQA